MAKINAKVQLSPVKTHQDIVDEEDEEDGEDHTGDDEKLLSRLNGYRTPQKTSMDAAAYPKDGGLNNHEKHRHNEPHASKEDSYNDRRKSKSIFARVTGFLFTQSPSVEPSSQSVLPTQVVPIPLGKGRGGSTPPPEMYQTPMPWSDTLEGDAAMEPVDSATSIEGPPENGNQLEDPARSTGISLHLKEVPEVARPPEASMLSLVKPRPGDHSTKKRPSPRADPYDIPPSPTNTNGEEYADDFVRKSHKRVKLTKKKQPKQPIVVPKTHKQTGTIVENTNDNEETLVGGAVIVQIESHPPTKRKRGRPPKKTTQPDNWVPMVASTHHGTTNGNPSSLDGPGIPADGSEGIEDPYIGEENISAPFVPENLSSAHAPDLGGGDDISDILMNTSLEKTPHLPQVQKPVNNNTKNNSNRSNSTEAEHDGSDDGSENGPDPEILPSPHLTYSQRPHKASSQRDFEIDLDAFEIISANLKRVGQKSNKKNGLKPVKKAKVKSKTANRLARKLDLLNKAYDNLRTAKEAGESEEDAKTAFVAVYDALKMATERLVSDHLDPRKAHSTKEILTDLYFVILQQYTHVILVGAKFYSDSDFVESEALLELSKLLDLLYGLVESALGLPKECQPIAPGYKTVQPIRAVRPVIARLRSALRDEIEDRKRKQKLAESKVLEAKRLKDRQDEEKRLKLKKRREKKEIHKQQARAIERLYADPICGRYLKGQEAKMAGRRRAKSAVSAAGRQYHEVDDDPFADDDIERVRVIPKNNNRQHKKKPFSKKEVGRFVDIMRVERGAERYVKVARVLGRSMEDVFDLAKDFQEAMDRQHEIGRFNGPHDEWTYGVFVESH